MERREALLKTAYLMGGTISAPAMAGILQGCKAEPQGPSWVPQFLTPEQGAMVTDIAEIILPATETPGAKDVGVHEFIDSMLDKVYKEKDRDRFVKGLDDLEADAESTFQKSFASCNTEEQTTLIQKLNVPVTNEMLRPDKDRSFFLMMKELTLLGFFTSEVGASQVLQYDPVPGAYRGCVPLEEIGKTWAT